MRGGCSGTGGRPLRGRRAGCLALRGGGSEGGAPAATRTGTADGEARASAAAGARAAGSETFPPSAARADAGQRRGSARSRRGQFRQGTMSRDERALQEMAFCRHILAKGGRNVVTETLRDVPSLSTFEHYPKGEVFDPESGAQWFYHCHAIGEGGGEHGHFHCFMRPQGAEGPVHHLAAVGVDAYGRLMRLFTVNQWVVGDDWLDAEGTAALLPRFDVQMPQPSYLVNRWLTAVFRAYQTEIVTLIRARDRKLAAHEPAAGTPVREDRALEIASELAIAAA